MASTCSQVESSSSTEATSPLNDDQIDIDLLLALHRKSTDEESSSLSASDASSDVSQENGWERDDEFTYTHNTDLHNTVNDYFEGHKPSGSGENSVNKVEDNSSKSQPKPQRECKTRDEIRAKQRIEENPDDMEFNEPWDGAIEDQNQPSGHSQETPTKLKKFGLVGVRKPNWEFPAFPVDDKNSSASTKSHISITCFARQTQTEPKDWALLELRQRNKDSNEGLETESSDGEESPIETTVDPNRNLLKVMLHKGTFTCDLPDDLTRDQKLNTLRQKFPKAEDNHLNEILDACLEDFNWAEKVLSELNDEHFDVGALEQLQPNAEPSVSSDLDSESTSTEDEFVEALSDQKNSEEQEFYLTLDPFLAAQLQSQFGYLTDSSASQELTLKLSHGVARLLHHNWKKSLSQKSAQNSYVNTPTTSQSISICNNNLNKNKIISNGKPKNTLDLEKSTPKSELQEIMDLEMAKALSRQEYDESLAAEALKATDPTQRKVAKELLSTKMKRDQLYQRYPGVDQSSLDTIFESNNYLLGKTIDMLDNSLGLLDDFSSDTERLIASERVIRSSSPANEMSRAASPSKPIRKTVDIKAVLSDMNALLEKKHEYHDKTRLAFQRKMYAVASYYGDEVTQLQKKIERLSNDIVDTMLINCSNTNHLDLHGLHIREVNTILSEYLRRKSEELRKTPGKRRLCVEIITGYGATKGVQGSIKPAVIQYLRQKSLTFEMVNMGVIRVTLTP